MSLAGAAWAQGATIQRQIQVQPGKETRVGVFTNILSTCTSGPLPAIQLTAEPAHGKVTVRRGRVQATNVRQCLSIDVPAFILFYRPAPPDFIGTDAFTITVKYPAKTEIQRYTVSISSQPGAGI